MQPLSAGSKLPGGRASGRTRHWMFARETKLITYLPCDITLQRQAPSVCAMWATYLATWVCFVSASRGRRRPWMFASSRMAELHTTMSCHFLVWKRTGFRSSCAHSRDRHDEKEAADLVEDQGVGNCRTLERQTAMLLFSLGWIGLEAGTLAT